MRDFTSEIVNKTIKQVESWLHIKVQSLQFLAPSSQIEYFIIKDEGSHLNIFVK